MVISIFAVAAFFAVAWANIYSVEIQAPASDTSLEGMISRTLAKDKGAVGTRIDEHVTLKDVYRSPPHQLNYVLIVSGVTEFFTRSDWRLMTERRTIFAACEDHQTRRMLHRGGAINYQYFGPDGMVLDTIAIDAHTCSLI